jgi:hypothetical protein
MFDRRHPLGWLFYLVLTAAVSSAQTPTTSTVSENLLGGRTGAEKKDAAMSFVSAALQLSDAVTARHIVDEDKFKLGLSSVIDGVVLCLNASTWSKPAQP